MAKINSIGNATGSLTIDPGASGDSFTQFSINTTGQFRIGVDESASNAFKISQGSALGTNDTFIMTTAGERTMPLQPAFLAYKSSNSTNVTGGGTLYTVISDTEVYDQNSDYNNTTGIFTAPVTGRYLLSSMIRSFDITAAMTTGQININSSNRLFLGSFLNWAAIRTVSTFANFVAQGMTIQADMDAADTAQMQITIYGATDIADIAGDSNGTTTFAGYLMC